MNCNNSDILVTDCDYITRALSTLKPKIVVLKQHILDANRSQLDRSGFISPVPGMSPDSGTLRGSAPKSIGTLELCAHSTWGGKESVYRFFQTAA